MIGSNGGTLNLGSLLYVCRSSLTNPDDNNQMTNIKSLSVVRNHDLDVTGLLIVTPIFWRNTWKTTLTLFGN